MFVLPYEIEEVHAERDMQILFDNFPAYKEINPFEPSIMARLKIAERLLSEDKQLRRQLKDPTWVPRADPETLKRAQLLRSSLIPDELV